MFSKYEGKARELAHLEENKVLIVTGTGFNDIKELQTDDFNKLLKQEEADFDSIWELYIAAKIAIKLGKSGYYTSENLMEFYKQAGLIEDFRILSILRQLWGMVIGTPIQGIDTGMLEAQQGRGSADSSFEIPKLFRVGLGLVLRGRP